MALLDYKIARISHDNRHVTCDINVYRGTISTQSETIGGVTQDVNRYRRIATVRTFRLEYDVPRDMTRDEFLRKARAYLNNRLLSYAQANGHTVITGQQDVSELEPVQNANET